MPVVSSVTETDVFAALRAVLIEWIPDGVEVIRGNVNRVSEPAGQSYIVMTPLSRTRLSTTVTGFDPDAGTRKDEASTQIDIQIDVHGPDSAENAQAISTLFRSDAGCDALNDTGIPVAPLQIADPRQLPFVGGERQYTERWSIDLSVQALLSITSSQDFTTKISPVLSAV